MLSPRPKPARRVGLRLPSPGARTPETPARRGDPAQAVEDQIKHEFGKPDYDQKDTFEQKPPYAQMCRRFTPASCR